MSNTLLSTKLYVPPARAGRVARSRLTRALAEGFTRKLTLISAPAGFGKTTLLAECIAVSARHDLKFGWLSLDEGDNDAMRFLAYLIAACQSAQPELGAPALAMLRSPQPPPLEALLTELINDLAQAQAFVLVLDDYHVVTAPAVHEALTFLLDHLPPSLHVVIATRSDPPLPLARFRARGQLLELRASGLRFTPEEAGVFLNQTMGLRLSPANIAALEARTEGWVAGLQLAALSMQGRADVEPFIVAFTGSDRYIIGYLVEEVLERQAEPVQQFLLQTSVLARMHADLCNALTQRSDGASMLAHLAASNLFLIPLDDHAEWYRYHHLFAEVLQSRLQKTQPALAPVLHRRASDWYEQHGFAQEAIEHAIAGQDWTRAARLVHRAGDAYLKRSETSTVQQWLDALPDTIVRSQAQLCLLRAELCGLSHQLAAAEQYLQDAEQAMQADASQTGTEREHVAARVRFLRTGLALNAGDLTRTIALAQEALRNLSPAESQMRGWLLLRLGTALEQTNDLAGAAEALSESRRLSQSQGDLLTALYAMDNLASAFVFRAQLARAAGLYREALELFAAARMPITGLIHADLAEVLYEWNDLAGAQSHLREAVELGKKGGLPRTLVNAYVQLVRVLLATDDLPGAREALQQASQLVEKYDLPLFFAGRVEACAVRLWLIEGDVPSAVGWAQRSGLSVSDPLSLLREVLHLALVRVLSAQGEWKEALGLLTRLEQNALSSGRTGSVIEMLALRSCTLQAGGETPAALQALERALTLAEPHGYVRTFVDEGEPMRWLLERAKPTRGGEQGGRPVVAVNAYVRKLLAAFPRSAEGRPSTPSAQPLREPLSERELEILRLIGAGRTNRQIAEALVLAVGTVKKHTNNIFGKLGVSNRTQAVSRARSLGLLDA